MEQSDGFTSIAQRAASTYLHALTNCLPSTEDQRQLHSFFQRFYGALFLHPEQFGLPLTPDGYYISRQPDETARKADLKKRLKRPKDIIAGGLAFLRLLGREGVLQDQTLRIDPVLIAEYQKKMRPAQLFLRGLAEVGLVLQAEDSTVTARCMAFPGMLVALKVLALACDQYQNTLLGNFHFARCDFRALQNGFVPDALDLYQVLPPAEFARYAEMHQFFVGRGYKVIVSIHDVSAWSIQYQGQRDVKATPLYQVDYDERHVHPLPAQIKLASVNRIAHLLTQEPRFLQDDYFRRANRCNSPNCDWCKDKKNLGPSTIAHDGINETFCWYTNPSVPMLNEESMAVIRQYALMHEKLARPV